MNHFFRISRGAFCVSNPRFSVFVGSVLHIVFANLSDGCGNDVRFCLGYVSGVAVVLGKRCFRSVCCFCVFVVAAGCCWPLAVVTFQDRKGGEERMRRIYGAMRWSGAFRASGFSRFCRLSVVIGCC